MSVHHRKHEEFNIGGINIAVDELQNHSDYISDCSKSILVYCLSEKRSAEAVRKIKSIFPEKNVYSLKGGIQRTEL